jgi:NADH dehydrogenase
LSQALEKTAQPLPHVVIIGGGFGGLWATRALAKAPVRITLLDQHNHHLFQPLLYEVATAALNPSNIATPIRRIVRRQRNVTVVLGRVERIDAQGKRVLLKDGAAIGYDHLIVAAGATHSYFGHPEWGKDAPGLKTIDDALEIRRRVLVAYEAAEREADEVRRRAWLTFVVIGGGPTGVELGGALAQIARHVLEGDFRRIDPASARVLLLEAGPRVLASFSPATSQSAREQLERLGCEVQTGRMVTGVDAGGVSVGPERVEARTVIWAAGVQASPLANSLGAPLDKQGRVLVQPDLTIPGHPEVQAIGDMARFEQGGKNVTGLAPAAMQMGRHAAHNVLRALRGEPPAPFRYLDKGSLATIGRAAAVAERGRLRISGLLAWVFWLVIHIFFLIGFRNRLLVLSEWALMYLRNERGARLITGDVEPLLEREAGPPADASRIEAPVRPMEKVDARR